MLPGWHLRRVQPRHVPKTNLQRDLQVQEQASARVLRAAALSVCPGVAFAFVSETGSEHKPEPGLAVCEPSYCLVWKQKGAGPSPVRPRSLYRQV